MDVKQWLNGRTWVQLGKVLYFDEQALASFKGQSSLVVGTVLVLLAILFESFFSPKPFYLAFLGSASKLFGALLIVYVSIKILSSESHFRFEQFLFGVSLAYMVGLILMGIVVNIGSRVLEASSYLLLLQVKQVYLMLMFSFSAETFSELRSWKSVTIGLVSMTVLFILFYLIN